MCVKLFIEEEKMYEQIITNIQRCLTEKEMTELQKHNIHLGIFIEPYLTYMLAGQKTIESRFSKAKISPYEKIKKGDIVFIKRSGGPVIGYFTVKEVHFFDFETTPIEYIKEKYAKELCVNKEFWNKKKDSKYATLIEIDNLKELSPFTITKKNMQTWIVLTSKKH